MNSPSTGDIKDGSLNINIRQLGDFPDAGCFEMIVSRNGESILRITKDLISIRIENTRADCLLSFEEYRQIFNRFEV